MPNDYMKYERQFDNYINKLHTNATHVFGYMFSASQIYKNCRNNEYMIRYEEWLKKYHPEHLNN